ncbi:hypothetical protein HQ587_00190 [bacterium]|nr:hypothetical protein [bacterium]
MKIWRKKWQGDKGSVDLIQLVVGLMIISIAAVGTLKALYWGYEQLDFQMRHRKAISIARSHVEYLQGRLHSDFDETRFQDAALKAGNITNPLIKLLDERDPSIDYDNIYCEVSHYGLEPINDPQTKGTDFWKIRVYVRWDEPGTNSAVPLNKVFFEARMVPSGS